MTTLDFDELNKLTRYAFAEWQSTDKPLRDLIDEYLDLLIMCYIYGNNDANTELDSSVELDTERLYEVVYAKVADKNWQERVEEYAPEGQIEEIVRVIETDGHRIYSDSKQRAAEEAGARYKRWETMRDDRVRDTHEYLQSMSVGITERFYTFDNDSALAPGGFTMAENNVGCRCTLSYYR